MHETRHPHAAVTLVTAFGRKDYLEPRRTGFSVAASTAVVPAKSGRKPANSVSHVRHGNHASWTCRGAMLHRGCGKSHKGFNAAFSRRSRHKPAPGLSVFARRSDEGFDPAPAIFRMQNRRRAAGIRRWRGGDRQRRLTADTAWRWPPRRHSTSPSRMPGCTGPAPPSTPRCFLP